MIFVIVTVGDVLCTDLILFDFDGKLPQVNVL